jgi:alkylation response protein AidB-like acyl-CoA dehydrogenase
MSNGAPRTEDVRDEVRSWLAANWDRSLPAKVWLPQVVDARWATPSWPVEWFGRGWPADLGRVVEEEFQRVHAPGSGQDRFNLYANTALAFGSDDVRRRFVRPLLTGEIMFCLLYSEPGAGSDLASVQTRAERDGDEWVVSGQKVWTSGAAEADYGMLIARTDWDVPKHQGLTFFFFPMKQPGVVVRPIKQITGETHFNEVFITDARVPDANRIGELSAGWRVLQTALAYERSVMGEGDRAPARARTQPAGVDPRERRVMGARQPTSGSEVDLVALARDVGRAGDAVARQGVAAVNALRTVNRWNAQRAKAALEQGSSSPVQSLGKLAMSRILHEGARVQGRLLGAEAMLDGPSFERADAANFQALNAYFTSIGGGTDQIQRNIIGERILGLPREPEVDRDVPFREARKATVERR